MDIKLRFEGDTIYYDVKTEAFDTQWISLPEEIVSAEMDGNDAIVTGVNNKYRVCNLNDPSKTNVNRIY